MRIDRFLTLHCVSPIRRMLVRDKGMQIPILMYHSISEQLDDHQHPYYQTVTTPERFEQQMCFLNQSGYELLTLSAAVQLLQEVPLKLSSCGRPAVITFDDGLRDFYTTAFPILEKFAFKATVFLTSGLINKTFLTGRECLKEIEIRELAAKGIEFGSHTDNHPQLKKLPTDDIAHELSVSKITIETIISSPVTLFSYPYKFPEENQEFTKSFASLLVTQGYSSGVTTIIGNAKSGDNPLFLKRLPINDYDDASFFQAKLQGDYDWLHTIQLTTKKLRAILGI
jgi:peptidoglycan/xylan/chitin deacetylase (PgdA/CDA1 family)